MADAQLGRLAPASLRLPSSVSQSVHMQVTVHCERFTVLRTLGEETHALAVAMSGNCTRTRSEGDSGGASTGQAKRKQALRPVSGQKAAQARASPPTWPFFALAAAAGHTTT